MAARLCPECGTSGDPAAVCSSCGYDPTAPDPSQEADLREPERSH